tara:strand:+ start:87 stop:1076 length:990 start_codon:yes stop_codon:yes gene_type:complete
MGIFDKLFGRKNKSESNKITQKEKYQRFEDERSKELEKKEKNKPSEEVSYDELKSMLDGRLKNYEDEEGELKWFNEDGDLLNLEQIIKSEFRLGVKKLPMLNGRILHGSSEKNTHLNNDLSDFKKINGYLFQWFYKRNNLDNRGRLVVFNGDCNSNICKDENLWGIYKDGIEVTTIKKEESVTENIENEVSEKKSTKETHEIEDNTDYKIVVKRQEELWNDTQEDEDYYGFTYILYWGEYNDESGDWEVDDMSDPIDEVISIIHNDKNKIIKHLKLGDDSNDYKWEVEYPTSQSYYGPGEIESMYNDDIKKFGKELKKICDLPKIITNY